MKVAELTPPLLDYWVARAEGYEQRQIYIDDGRCFVKGEPGSKGGYAYSKRYSTSWRDGGPLIDKYDINLPEITFRESQTEGKRPYKADINYELDGVYIQYGKTKLIAAMRCRVASVYGEEVPEE